MFCSFVLTNSAQLDLHRSSISGSPVGTSSIGAAVSGTQPSSTSARQLFQGQNGEHDVLPL